MSAVKKAVKKVGKFVKKHWKKIVIAAAVVFTAGAASMGLAGLSSTFASQGLMGTIGVAMKTGVSVIGGSLGIGKGAAGAATQAAGAGAKAASAGLSATKAGVSASKLAAGAAKAVGAGVKGVTAMGATTGGAAAGALGGATKAITPTLMAGGGGGAAGAAGAAAANGGFWSGLGGQALIQGGIGAATQLLAAKAEEEDEPKGFYGVDLQGKANLSPNQLAFSDADITGGASSFRRGLMYDPPNGG